MTLTFSKAFDDVTNNAEVLKMCGALAEKMAIAYDRVVDAYGGYFGNPSPTLPTKAANATRMLNASNATKKTAWTVDLVVQPDPFAATVDNAATSTAATDTTALAAMNKITETKYGKATATAKVITEAVVKFVKAPAATGGSKKITIAGSTDVAGYVYCGVQKTPSRRMLNTTNSTTATKKAAAPVVKEVFTLQTASASAKYNIQRTETKTGALAWAFDFKNL